MMKTETIGGKFKITSVTVPSTSKVYTPECGEEIPESEWLQMAANWHQFICETCRNKMFERMKDER